MQLACDSVSRLTEQGGRLVLHPYSLYIVEELLNVEGININLVSKNNNMTALSLAIQQLPSNSIDSYNYNYLEKILKHYRKEGESIAETLINKGADIIARYTLKDPHKKSDKIMSIEATPLHTVLYEGKRMYGLFKAMVSSKQFHYKMLLVKDNNGNTVLDLVAQIKDKDKFKQFSYLLFKEIVRREYYNESEFQNSISNTVSNNKSWDYLQKNLRNINSYIKLQLIGLKHLIIFIMVKQERNNFF